MFNGRKKVRKYIRFYGEVQAVGFRYYASTAAAQYGATGWVKNEYDGSVSMEIQGSEEQIQSVLTALNRGRYIVIDRTEVKQIPPVETETGFRVRY